MVFGLQLTSWGAIAAILGAIILSLSTAIILYKWGRRKYVLKNPLDVQYLIPKREYPEASFNGAPREEIKPVSLTVGIGRYRLMHVITPRVDIIVDPIVLRFEGSDKNKPKRYGSDNPFIVNEIPGRGGPQYLDWWGDIHPTYQGWPRYLHLGDTLVIGNRIETTGPWQGKAYFEFPIRDVKVIVKKLTFTVKEDEQADQIPFLKGWSDEKETKNQTEG